jgi:hypothetical protein
MFGHGQVEGFREKYGMEFRKPKWDETPDEGLIAGHDWKIFPLLHRRSLFADVENFFLFDLFTPNGSVDENVFAYSNIHNDERGLVLYHNRFADTKGWIKTSAAYLDKTTGDLRQKSLAEALGLPFDGCIIFKDYITRLEYIRSCEELWSKGLYVELHAYQHHVFMDWRFVESSEWKVICDALNGAGVASVQAKWEEMFGSKDEGRRIASQDELPKVKKPRKKAVTKKAVAKKLAVKKSVTKKVVKEITKKATNNKPAASKTSAKKSPAKATKSKPNAAAKKSVVKKSVSKKSSSK